MARHAPALALAVAILFATPTGPAQASGDRETLSDETIGLMIDDSGPGQAEALLGVLYLRGMRIESDPVAASAWLDRAARAGHPAGLYGAARMHADGIGVPVDAARARQLLGNADPARFGPLADAVRRLRHDLGLPDATTADTQTVTATTPKADGDTPKVDGDADRPPPIVPTTEQATAPVPVAAAGPAVTSGPARGSEPAVAAEPAATEPPTDAGVPPAEVIAGPFAQLATLFSEASTSSEMARIRGIVPAHLLQGRELSVRPVRLGDGRTAWRIVATGFVHRDDVRIFCGLMAASGLGCLPRQ